MTVIVTYHRWREIAMLLTGAVLCFATSCGLGAIGYASWQTGPMEFVIGFSWVRAFNQRWPVYTIEVAQ
jgi:hypothetical protein